jgi:outer membrane protein OmpA-like peptidoglycan-associated protein
VRLLVDTANGKVQVLAEAGAGITQSDVSREVERFVKGQLNLGPVSIEVKFTDKTTTPAGGASTSSQTTTVTGQVPLGQSGVSLGCTYTHGGPGNDSITCGPQVSLGQPPKPEKVSCYACECPPPLPDYTCRKTVKPHTEHVVDQTKGDKTERVLYLYNSDVPAHEDEFKGQVAGIAGLVGSNYKVTDILGYASPEASRAYNEKLGEKRAKNAYAAIAAALQEKQLTTTLPAPKGVGELLGDSSVRKGKEAYDSELIRELRDRLRDLDDEARLDLLGVDGPRRSDPAQRAQVLEDIKEFMEGKDADGKKLGQRALWEKIFPHLRRVEVLLHRDEISHEKNVEASDKASACDDADKAFIDGELGPIPEGKRLPQEACS